MDLVKKDPNAELISLHQQTDHLIDSFFDQEPLVISKIQQNSAFDLIETEEEILVTTELPGIDSEDISMTFSGDKLIIKGELKTEMEDNDENFLHTGESHGRFNRVIPLPVPIDSRKIKSDFNKGLLEIHLAKCFNSEYFIG